MKFEILEIENHQILRAKLELDKDNIALALEQATLKAAKVHKDSPSGETRSDDEIFNQNFLGTLADIVCARILKSYFKKYANSIDVTRYDDVRTDSFQYPDQYDIKLSNQGIDYFVEVRSSVCIFLPLESMLKKWQILGQYVSDSKGTTETEKHFYLRPIYHLSTFEENKRTHSYQKKSAIRLVENGELRLYFVGGATSKLLHEKGRNEDSLELKQGKATKFRVLNIKDGLDAKKMLETIVQLTTK